MVAESAFMLLTGEIKRCRNMAEKGRVTGQDKVGGGVVSAKLNSLQGSHLQTFHF